MPDNGATGAITSAPEGNSSRGLFTNRRLSKKQQPAAPTTFAGAPDFFNQAAAQSNDYITIGEEPKATDPGTKKRLIILGALVGIIALVGVGALVVPNIMNGIAHSDSRLKENWTKLACAFAYGKGECSNLSDDVIVRLTVKNEKGQIDYDFYKKSIQEFKETISGEPSEKEAAALRSADSLLVSLTNIEIYDSLSLSADSFVTDNIVSGNSSDTFIDNYIIQLPSGEDYRIARSTIKDYMVSLSTLLESYYSRGCNTAELLDSMSCRSSNHSDDEAVLLANVTKMSRAINMSSSSEKTNLKEIINDTIKAIEG
jgi:hypothetical protein